MKKAINFKIEKKIPNFLGRAGVLTTPHGDILTPSFVVVIMDFYTRRTKIVLKVYTVLTD